MEGCSSMKNRFGSAVLSLVLIVLSLAVFAACGTPSSGPAATEKASTEKPGTVDDTTPVPVSDPTDAPTAAPTEEPTPVPQPTEDTRPLPESGTMVYYEDFSSYGEIGKNEDVLKALGWKMLTVEDDKAPSDWTADMAIKDGKLEITNYPPDGRIDGKDGYLMMLDGDYMDRVLKTGSYTLQYDVNYYSAANFKRFLVIVTEYDSEGFNSFHFRIGGYGNNQLYYQGTWFATEENDENDLYAARKNTNEKGSTIAYKLCGIEGKIEDDSSIPNFTNVPLTIRVVRENGYATVYMKTAEMTDFIKVSQASSGSEGYAVEPLLKGKAVCFKTGAKINGTVDNIAIWTGTGEMPADHTVTYEP